MPRVRLTRCSWPSHAASTRQPHCGQWRPDTLRGATSPERWICALEADDGAGRRRNIDAFPSNPWPGLRWTRSGDPSDTVAWVPVALCANFDISLEGTQTSYAVRWRQRARAQPQRHIRHCTPGRFNERPVAASGDQPRHGYEGPFRPMPLPVIKAQLPQLTLPADAVVAGQPVLAVG